jgi:hypothetical protein
VAVRIQSSLLGWLAKAAPGTNKPDADDAILSLRKDLVNCGRFPFPITRTTGATGLLLGTEKVQGSIIFHRLDLIATALALDVFFFPEGVWDVTIDHACIVRGAVADLTSDMTLLLQVIDSGVTRFSILNQLVNSLTLNQRYHNNFTLTVSKEIPTNIRLQNTAGLGTGTSFSLLSIIANRIY